MPMMTITLTEKAAKELDEMKFDLRQNNREDTVNMFLEKKAKERAAK